MKRGWHGRHEEEVQHEEDHVVVLVCEGGSLNMLPLGCLSRSWCEEAWWAWRLWLWLVWMGVSTCFHWDACRDSDGIHTDYLEPRSIHAR